MTENFNHKFRHEQNYLPVKINQIIIHARKLISHQNFKFKIKLNFPSKQLIKIFIFQDDKHMTFKHYHKLTINLFSIIKEWLMKNPDLISYADADYLFDPH